MLGIQMNRLSCNIKLLMYYSLTSNTSEGLPSNQRKEKNGVSFFGAGGMVFG